MGSQVLRAAAAGADAVLFNLMSPDDAWPFFRGNLKAVQQAAGGMALVQVSDIDGLADAIRADAGPVTVTLDPQEPTWGYLRVFDESSASDVNADGTPEFEQVGLFNDLPHVTGELFNPPGTWTIHNTEVNGDRAYSSCGGSDCLRRCVRARPRTCRARPPPLRSPGVMLPRALGGC